MTMLQRLERAIAASGKSKSSIARAVGIKPSAISDVLGGRRRLYFDQVALLAKAVGCSLDWLAGEGDEDSPSVRPPVSVRAWVALGHKIGFGEGLRVNDPDEAEVRLVRLESEYLQLMVDEMKRDMG